jgi:uncharacterized protein
MGRLLNFESFLELCGDKESLSLYQEVPFPNFGVQKLMDLFHEFCLVGGFPDVIKRYAVDRKTSVLKPLYETHLEQLFAKAITLGHTKTTQERILQIYQDAFAFAAMRIKYKGFSDPAFPSRMVGEIFRKLDQMNLLGLIFPMTQTALPMKPDQNRSPRIQLPDTGLVTYYTGIQDALAQSTDLSAVFNRQISLHVDGICKKQRILGCFLGS